MRDVRHLRPSPGLRARAVRHPSRRCHRCRGLDRLARLARYRPGPPRSSGQREGRRLRAVLRRRQDRRRAPGRPPLRSRPGGADRARADRRVVRASRPDQPALLRAALRAARGAALPLGIRALERARHPDGDGDALARRSGPRGAMGAGLHPRLGGHQLWAEQPAVAVHPRLGVRAPAARPRRRRRCGAGLPALQAPARRRPRHPARSPVSGRRPSCWPQSRSR